MTILSSSVEDAQTTPIVNSTMDTMDRDSEEKVPVSLEAWAKINGEDKVKTSGEDKARTSGDKDRTSGDKANRTSGDRANRTNGEVTTSGARASRINGATTASGDNRTSGEASKKASACKDNREASGARVNRTSGAKGSRTSGAKDNRTNGAREVSSNSGARARISGDLSKKEAGVNKTEVGDNLKVSGESSSRWVVALLDKTEAIDLTGSKK